MRILLVLIIIAGLATPAPAVVVYQHDPAIRFLVGKAIDGIFDRNRSQFLDTYALFPSYSELQAMYGEDFAFAGDEAAFLLWREELSEQRKLAEDFYALARQAIMASSVGLRDPVVLGVFYAEGRWLGLEAISGIEVDVQLTPAIRARFDLGTAARFPTGWAFVRAPTPVVQVIKPALRGNDIDWIDLTDLDAALP